MKKIIFGIILICVVCSTVKAQKKLGFFQWRKDHSNELPSLDTTRFLKPYGVTMILLDSGARPIDIPNLFQRREVGSMEYSTMPIRKLSGRNSGRMPGTEQLDKREQLEDAMKSKGKSDSLYLYKK